MSHRQDDALATMEPLDTVRFPLWGSRLIEASAGTGKTYTIASLYVRLVLGHGMLPGQRPLTPPEILVVTFTRAATRELRDRIRRRLNEAAACFLGELEGDSFLQALRDDYPSENWPGCARQLQIAAEWMDDAAVSTIDAWCSRMLREHAFDSASLFNVDLDTDATETVLHATQDYWRLYVAPLESAAFAKVRKVTGRCDALAAALENRWMAHAHLLEAGDTPEDLIQSMRDTLQTCKQPWREWVPEMRDILQQASDDDCFKKAGLRSNTWPNWLNQLQAWADDPEAEHPFTSDTPWLRLNPEWLAEIWKKGDPPQHPGFASLETLRQLIEGLTTRLDGVWVHAACWVRQRVDELRRQRAVLDYDGLQKQLATALQGANGARLAQQIRKQYPAALIDEFQDTNPIQYRIFDSVYDVDTNREDIVLALIGDPKQAIYRFRGADIHAYLDARRACEGRLYTLGSNYRSSAGMVAAVNHVFTVGEHYREHGAFLFLQDNEDGTANNPVPFLPVTAGSEPGEFLVEGEPPRALTVWHDGLPETRNNDIRMVDIAAACASEVLRLLQLGAQGKAGFRRAQRWQPLQARDIAILVNTGKEAGCLKTQLALRGIRSVYLSDKGSVYGSAAGAELLAWLRACAEPEQGGHVRAALATASLGMSWHELDSFISDEVRWEAMLERFAAYKEQWQQRGVLPMLRSFMQEFSVPARLFAEQESSGTEGERRLTDLLHLAELLQAASVGLDGEHALIRYLEEKISEKDKAASDGDTSQLRLESDAGLLQIVTVHKSKGLEYPLVFYPYGYYSREDDPNKLPVRYRDASGTPQVLAHRNGIDSATLQQIAAETAHERLAEDLRKLYVALTRARHATWMAVSPYQKSLPGSAMGYLLGGAEACVPDALQASLAELAGDCEHIAVQPLPEPVEGRYVPVEEHAPAQPVWRTVGRRIRQRWTLSSYSSLSRFAMERMDGEMASAEDAVQAQPDEARRDTFLETYLADETHADAELDHEVITAGPAGVLEGIHGFPKGAKAGSFLHDLLEWGVRQGPQQLLAQHDIVYQYVERRCRSRGWEQHTDAVVAWLKDFFTRPFHIVSDQGASDLILADLQTVIPEMEFWFGIQDADLPALDALVYRYFLAGRPRALISRGQLNGLLRGFIDLVFEHEGRYYVADYKSNWLGTSAQAYDESAVAQAVLEHRYDLQAALYLFALHRLLESRLGDLYDYDHHMGGAMIFFIRGARSASQGVLMERPPRELMDKMEILFSRDLQAEDDGGTSCS